MTRILKPELIIYSQMDNNETDQSILDWLQQKKTNIPVLIFLTNRDWQRCKKLFDNQQFDKVFQPITKSSLLDKCHQMVQKNNSGIKKPAKKKILIVDDTPIMLRNLKKMLDSKYDVALATSGKQALNAIPKEQPDLILLDYEMPEMNGKEVFETMLADDDMKYIPVLFLTSVSDRKSVVSILQSKPAGYILKPADQEQLLATVAEILS